MRRARNERGVALVEAAVTIPILLLIAVGIFEFGRAYQTWQILTNAAREGARIAVLPATDTATVESRVRDYMQSGQLENSQTAPVTINRGVNVVVNGATISVSDVIIDYPFDFMVLQPVARLVNAGSTSGASLTMRASARMRNEAM
jgi:Flp pilus assembly protein TadG